jgi:signal transduction histidine kinase/CheY-like chemotaxis protein/HPt (histidine-containing phosphotransfer) domain-containing protein
VSVLEPSQTRSLWRSGGLILLITCLFVVWLLVKPGTHAQFVAGDNVLQGLLECAGLALALPLGLSRRRELHGAPSSRAIRHWAPLLLSCGILSYALGQIIWTLNEDVLHLSVLFPSWADAGYLGSYPFVLLGILLLPGRPRGAATRTRIALDGVMIMTALITVSWYFILGPTLLQANNDLLAKAVSTAYPAATLVLMVCLVLLSAPRDAALRPVVGILALALGIIVVTDSIYGYQELHNIYATGGALDVGWPLGYMLVGLGARALRLSLRTGPAADHAISRPATTATPEPLRPLWHTLLPYTLLPLVGILLGYVWLDAGHRADRLATGVSVGAAVLVILVLARQIVALLENRRLYTDLNAIYGHLEARNRQAEEDARTLSAHVAERKRSEDALRQANADLARASQAKSAFLATMSHELRTPLNGVLGLTGLLLHTPLDARQQEYAAGIQTSGEVLLALISDILDLAKIEAGQLRLEEESLTVVALVENVVDMVTAQVRAKGLEIMAVVAPEVPEVLRGDATRLRQVLLNLVGNAVKFTAQGAVVVRVRVAQDMGATVLLRCSVIDTGIGITPEARTSLFDAFTQADSSTARRYGGAGLGLAICKHLVELMGGRIGVGSVVGRGSIFTFTAPLQRADVSDGALPPRTAPTLPVQALLVGGPAPLRAALHDQLAHWGATVTSAAGERAALRVARAAVAGGRPHDVLIVHRQAGGLDGLEVARRLREGAPLSSVPLVLLTPTAVEAREAVRAGIAAQLLTPVRTAQLYETFARLAGRTAMVPGPRPADQPRPLTPPPQRAGGGGRILVAEDNPINRLVTAHMLEELGYVTETAENGRQAVEAVARGGYDLVLMDCHMPEMDGFAATAAIRRREGVDGRHTPTVAVTADALSGDAERCLAAGMDDYLAKPVTAERLAAVVARWVEGHEEQAVAATPADRDAVDPAVLERLRAAGLLGEVVALYLRETPGQLEVLRRAAERGEAATLAEVAHSLKGSSAQLGATNVAVLAATLQVMGETGPAAGVVAGVDALEQEFGRVRAMLEAARLEAAPS